MYSTSGKVCTPKNWFSQRLRVPLLVLLLLQVILFNQATCAQVDYHSVSLPKCQESLWMKDQVEISKEFFPFLQAGNSTAETLQVKLIPQNDFRCKWGKGRASILHAQHDVHKVEKVATFLETGYLLHDKMYYSPEDYCFLRTRRENDTVVGVVVKICEPNCSAHKTACIQKCCDPTKVWDLKDYMSKGSMRCEASAAGNTWQPSLHDENTYKKIDTENAVVRYRQAHPRNFCGDHGFFMMTLKNYNGLDASPFHILDNGKVEMKVGPGTWEEVPSGQYCVDGAMNFDYQSGKESSASSIMMAGQFSGNDDDTVLMVCSDWWNDTETSSFDGNPNLLYVIAMLVASVFLFLTAVVYILLWNRQNVHGWTFLGYVLSLLFTFLLLSTAHLSTAANYDCTLIGIACHFFFISCFTWLSALNFDVFWTFRSSNPYPGRKKEMFRFLCYSIFAVGTPATIVSVGLILDKIYGDDPNSDVIVPRYGVTRCTMDRSADLPYLFGPIGFLLGCNIILFLSTVYLVYKSQQLVQQSGMKSSMLRHKIRFFFKLFMLAGITWIFEVVSWACTKPGGPVHWIWKFFDLVNILQAILIFVVFVCNRKTLQELTEKFPCLERFSAIMAKASGEVTEANAARKLSGNTVTHVSSVTEIMPGLNVVELR